MAVSPAVLAYYAEHVVAHSGRDRVPENFRPLDPPATGRSWIEGCAGGGKNLLELSLRASEGRIEDVRASCGLCNPAMYVAADLVCRWARGRALEEVLAVDPREPASLAPLFALLGGPGRPEDAREKFQYALHALRDAARSHRGWPPVPVPVPAYAAPTARDPDLDDDDDDPR